MLEEAIRAITTPPGVRLKVWRGKGLSQHQRIYLNQVDEQDLDERKRPRLLASTYYNVNSGLWESDGGDWGSYARLKEEVECAVQDVAAKQEPEWRELAALMDMSQFRRWLDALEALVRRPAFHADKEALALLAHCQQMRVWMAAVVQASQALHATGGKIPNGQEGSGHAGDALREMMQRAGRTPADVADHLQVTVQTVDRWFKTGEVSRENLEEAVQFLTNDSLYDLAIQAFHKRAKAGT